MSETNNTNTANDNSNAAAAPAPNGKRKKIMLSLAMLFGSLGLLYGLYWLLVSRHFEVTEDAYVQGNVVQITPQTGGTVARILVDDTDLVKAGQPLLSLDTADADVAVAQAEAQLAQTVREVRTLYASQAQSGANLGLRQAELERARDDLERRKSLSGTGAVAGEEIRHAELAYSAAQAAVAVAKEQLVSGRALTEGTTVQKHPNVQRAVARLQEAMLAQARATLYAPVAGQIAKRSAQVGQRINPGAPVMAIVPLDQLWVDANFKESQLRDMRIGQSATLVADVYGSRVKYKGKVVGMGAGTGSAFALLPAQNATGNWIKVVQRVPVRIALDSKQLAEFPLRVGLSMEAEVDMREQDGERIGKQNAARPATGYSANVLPVDSTIQSRIDAVIAANLK
jgi:membrane fusion protein (multidrug efflux system)